MDGIKKVCEMYGLGSLSRTPETVTGGLLHKMYHVMTDKGEYAVKVLNRGIMKRPEALQNTINSEIVSNALAGVVPVVAAKCFDGKYVIELAGSFYMVFDWLDAESVFAPEITEAHCEQIGRMLGRIHATNIDVDGMEKSTESRGSYD